MAVTSRNSDRMVALGLSACLILCLPLNSSVHGQSVEQKKLYVQDIIVPISKITLKTLDEDSLWTVHYEQDTLNLGAKFGAEVPSNYTLLNSGTWSQINDSTRVWRLEITSPNAVMLSFMFDDFFMPSGAMLLIYSSDYANLVGPYTERNNQSTRKFASALLEGQNAVIEYYEPISQTGNGAISINRVVHAYYNPFESSSMKNFCHTSACDAPPEWCNQERSVGLIFEGGTRLCSGVLLTNVERNYRPYFLTALHCGDDVNRDKNRVLDSDDIDAISQWVVYFGSCGAVPFATHGATIKEYRFNSDYLLVELNEQIPEPANVYYAGWNGKDVRPEEATSIHFPKSKNGRKQIAFSNDRPTQASREYITNQSPLVRSWRLIMSDGVMEKMSSGAPLFNEQHRVVAQFSGWESDPILGGLFGLTYCDRPNAEVDFGRFRNTMRHGARQFLDPNGGLFNRTRSMSGDEPPCETNLLLSNEPFLGNGIYEASQSVTAITDVQVRPGRNVEFTGGNVVSMKAGFRAHAGSNFKAHIQGCYFGCDPDFAGKSEELITSIEGILYEDSVLCTVGVGGQNLWVVNNLGNPISGVSTIVTDDEGSFVFIPGQIQALDTNLLMTFHCSNPDFVVPQAKTLKDWVLDSPIELFLDGCIASSRLASDSDEDNASYNRGFNIHPNPNSGTFTISGTDMQQITIMEASGKLVRQMAGPFGTTIEVSGLGAGLYVVRVQMADGGVETGRVVVAP